MRIKTKAQLEKEYSSMSGDVREYIEYAVYTHQVDRDDEYMLPDEDADSVHVELKQVIDFYAPTVKVLIRPQADKNVVYRALQKVFNHVANSGVFIGYLAKPREQGEE